MILDQRDDRCRVPSCDRIQIQPETAVPSAGYRTRLDLARTKGNADQGCGRMGIDFGNLERVGGAGANACRTSERKRMWLF